MISVATDPVFLAKNESPSDRRAPVQILALLGALSLCPVATLQEYLSRTASTHSDKVFLAETSDAPLSAKQISAKILCFNKKGSTCQMAHDYKTHSDQYIDNNVTCWNYIDISYLVIKTI